MKQYVGCRYSPGYAACPDLAMNRDIFDLLNAILKPHNDLRLKELWRDNAHSITYSNDPKLKVYVLQIMSIWLQNYCAPKYLYYLVPNAKKVIRQKDGTKEEKSQAAERGQKQG